ncbi:hypothetical protein [Poseidonibacter ostreae]|uniref:Uncharacterized protein n=1 Tax=Poseidonibacter ostreae TaxID=2654171 RepID=A0A6L4WSN4_9BACT|nr:hypothetical protein [Poseidonibacter ostreae]KAB7885000.1 hypothetical protein GA417_09745 [Poseidonibacter ostreae]KAB7888992.1 hypothetical protein GBG19_07325 [Poseidonibacter ostreae]KAB7891925.1 hypothetical protein GBG18_04875 [Poseidonibacter ostreae]
MSIKKLNVQLTNKLKKLDQLKDKKNKCVNDQHTFENDSLDYENDKKYIKLIDLDFDLAYKIEQIEKDIKSLRNKINYRKRISNVS